MLRLDKHARVRLILGRTDMRNSINGLSDMVANQLKLDALSGQYYVFCSQNDGYQKVYTIADRVPSTGYPVTSATVTIDLKKNGYRLPTEAEWE